MTITRDLGEIQHTQKNLFRAKSARMANSMNRQKTVKIVCKTRKKNQPEKLLKHYKQKP
jgi:hypothetical protein